MSSINGHAKRYVAISPTGQKIIFTNANKFCRDNPDFDLNPSSLHSCTRTTNTLKGWKIYLYLDAVKANVIN